MLTEVYEIEICLPEYGKLVNIHMPYEHNVISSHKKYGLLELFGRDCYTYRFKNFIPDFFEDDIEVEFTYNSIFLWVKIMYLVFIFTVLFLFIFALIRFKLNFKPNQKSKIN